MRGLPRALARIAVLAMAAILAGCAPSNEESPTIESTSSVSPTLLETVMSRGKLIAGVRATQKPFGFKNDDGELVGFEIDLVAGIARRLGVELELRVVEFKEAIPFTKDGIVDLAAALVTHTIARDAEVDFSVTYFMNGQALLARKDDGVKDIEDIARRGGKIGFLKGVAVESALSALLPEANLARFDESLEYCQALENGLVMAVASDLSVLLNNRTRYFKDPDAYVLVDAPLGTSPIAAVMRENESDFRDAVNAAIMDMIKTGEYRSLFEKWFGAGTEYALSGASWTPELWP